MDSKSQRFIQIIKTSIGYDPSIFFIGRNLPDVIKDMRQIMCPGLPVSADYLTTQRFMLQGPYGQQIAKINESDQRELFELIN